MCSCILATLTAKHPQHCPPSHLHIRSPAVISPSYQMCMITCPLKVHLVCSGNNGISQINISLFDTFFWYHHLYLSFFGCAFSLECFRTFAALGTDCT